MTHALNTFVLLITIPMRKITDFKLVLFSCRLFLHVTADLVRFYIILNLRKFERLWVLKSLKQNCKSGQNHEFIPFSKSFISALFVYSDSNFINSFFDQRMCKDLNKVITQTSALVKCFVWFICSLRLPF